MCYCSLPTIQIQISPHIFFFKSGTYSLAYKIESSVLSEVHFLAVFPIGFSPITPIFYHDNNRRTRQTSTTSVFTHMLKLCQLYDLSSAGVILDVTLFL